MKTPEQWRQIWLDKSPLNNLENIEQMDLAHIKQIQLDAQAELKVENEQLNLHLDTIAKALGHSKFDSAPVYTAIDQLKQQIAELMKDKERLDWLFEIGQINFSPDLISLKPKKYRYNISFPTDSTEMNIRLAIDAARKGNDK